MNTIRIFGTFSCIWIAIGESSLFDDPSIDFPLLTFLFPITLAYKYTIKMVYFVLQHYREKTVRSDALRKTFLVPVFDRNLLVTFDRKKLSRKTETTFLKKDLLLRAARDFRIKILAAGTIDLYDAHSLLNSDLWASESGAFFLSHDDYHFIE